MIQINNRGFTLLETAILIAIISIVIIPIYNKSSSMIDNRNRAVEISNRQNAISEIYDYLISDIARNYEKYLNDNSFEINGLYVDTFGQIKHFEGIDYGNITNGIISVDVVITTMDRGSEVSRETVFVEY